ncbi:MAG: tRNA pseudouridine(55) synthase TruB [Candidatus Sumerlaeia bacterium]|nr:tRNA pseudouridine(55) synthase TruB [Candidatus Sumerlaeia bacterium]
MSAPSSFNGIFLVDKPAGMTSHDVVDELRQLCRTRRVGHAGTLDPIADGLLILMAGEATKLSEYLQSTDKQYEGAMRLGFVSDTYDSDGNVQPGPGGRIPSLEALQEIADDLTGTVKQVPPPFSAKKVAGKKLYEYARAGKLVEVEAREVEVHDFELMEMEGDTLEFGVECSSGTYVRGLVHELGQRAGCGAVLTALRRTVVGPFDVENAHTLHDLRAHADNLEALHNCIIPMRDALPQFPAGFLTPGAEHWLRHGQAVPLQLVEVAAGERLQRGGLVVLCRVMGDAVALARLDPAPLSPPPKALAGHAGPWLQPIKLFDTAEAEAPG